MSLFNKAVFCGTLLGSHKHAIASMSIHNVLTVKGNTTWNSSSTSTKRLNSKRPWKLLAGCSRPKCSITILPKVDNPLLETPPILFHTSNPSTKLCVEGKFVHATKKDREMYLFTQNDLPRPHLSRLVFPICLDKLNIRIKRRTQGWWEFLLFLKTVRCVKPKALRDFTPQSLCSSFSSGIYSSGKLYASYLPIVSSDFQMLE